MRNLFFLVLLLSVSWGKSYAQQDTLTFEEVGPLFSELNDSLFHGHLLNRSFSQDSIMQEQISGDYSSKFNPLHFLGFLSVIETSSVNGDVAQATANIAQEIINFYSEKIYDTSKFNDEIPFGIAIHDIHWIDSSALESEQVIIQNNKVTPLISEDSIYRNKRIFAASPLEFRNVVTARQELVLDDRFIFLGDNVELHHVSVDVGNGYRRMKHGTSIKYSDVEDSLVGSAILNYQIDTTHYIDTTYFTIYNLPDDTTNNEGLQAKSDPDESEYLLYDSDEERYFGGLSGTVFKLNVMPRCNFEGEYINFNGRVLPKIKRPVIIITPYFPAIQGEDAVNTVTLFNQFNTWGVFNELSNRGYDIIMVENQTAFMPVKTCGMDFGRLIKRINNWKKQSYPNEDWENVVIGYSMGGQVAKYALKWLEYNHMENGEPHHHTRLYTSFDSPHHGARIPMGCQSVFLSHHLTGNIVSSVVYLSLVDGGSTSMVNPHIKPNILNFNATINRDIYKSNSLTTMRSQLLEDLNLNLQHDKSNLNDERLSFPAFTRNIGVTMGSFNKNYTDEYVLTPGMRLYEHNSGLKNSVLFASSYGTARPSYTRLDFWSFYTGTAIIHQKFRTFDISEWDLANGGFKSIFYDNVESNGVPTGAVQILRMNNGFFNQHYFRETSFMPVVSGLAIKPSLWANNDIHYNPQDEDLMYQVYNFDPVDDLSNFYGYPHLAHPNDHFDITPFEAIYADEITYEHIKPIQTIGDLNSNNPQGINYAKYLDSMKNFIVREVEDDIVCLQNYDLGDNQKTQFTNEEYKACYKALKEIRMGESVTPKTDVGKYTVTADGNLTVHAGEKIVMKPGFHAKAGSKVHAYIHYDECTSPSVYEGGKSIDVQGVASDELESNKKVAFQPKENKGNKTLQEDIKIIPNPNSGNFSVGIPHSYEKGVLLIMDLSGRVICTQSVNNNRVKINLKLPSGVYIVKYDNLQKEFYKKIIIQ